MSLTMRIFFMLYPGNLSGVVLFFRGAVSVFLCSSQQGYSVSQSRTESNGTPHLPERKTHVHMQFSIFNGDTPYDVNA